MLAIAAGLLGNKWIVGGLGALGIFIAVWSTAFYKGRASVDVPAIERAAFAKGQIARDGEWKTKLAAAEVEANAKVTEWQRKAEEAEAAAPTPTTAPELLKLCAGDEFCRK